MNWDKHARVMRLWGADDVVAAGRDAIERDIADALAEREQTDARAPPRRATTALRAGPIPGLIPGPISATTNARARPTRSFPRRSPCAATAG